MIFQKTLTLDLQPTGIKANINFSSSEGTIIDLINPLLFKPTNNELRVMIESLKEDGKLDYKVSLSNESEIRCLDILFVNDVNKLIEDKQINEENISVFSKKIFLYLVKKLS